MTTTPPYPSMIDREQALAILRQHARPLPVSRRAPAQALGTVVAADACSPGPVPPFSNSAMDGFAVRSREVAAASDGSPVTLPVAGHTAAGPVGEQVVPPGPCAWEIMTGAPVPPGFDAVVPVERTARTADGAVLVHVSPPAGDNVRLAGEDYAPRTPVVRAGETVTPERLMALSATGVQVLEVRARPRVAVIATGAELVDDATRPLRPGEIRDSNNPYLQAALPDMGAEVISAVTVGDDPRVFAAALAQALALRPDVILTSGAVSAGVHDFIPAALLHAGARIRFHKLQIRPGKPLLFATLPDGTACFGLPGNPLSVTVGLRFLVTPYLRALQGLPEESWPLAVLDTGHRKPERMTFFGKSRVTVDDDGRLRTSLLPGQESFRIAPLTAASGWTVLPPGSAQVEAGTRVRVAPLAPGRSLLHGG